MCGADLGTQGDLYVGDVGSDYWEEINRVPNPLDPANAGKMPNFGWPCYEGNYPYVVFAPNNYPICLALAEDPLYHPPFFSCRQPRVSAPVPVAPCGVCRPPTVSAQIRGRRRCPATIPT